MAAARHEAAIVDVEQDTGAQEEGATLQPSLVELGRRASACGSAVGSAVSAGEGSGAAAAAAAAAPAGADEEDWQMVTPGGSPRGSTGSCRTCLGAGDRSERESDCSETGAEAELNNLALADSILASRELTPHDTPYPAPATPAQSLRGGATGDAASQGPPFPTRRGPTGLSSAAAAARSAEDRFEAVAAAYAEAAAAASAAGWDSEDAASDVGDGPVASTAVAPPPSCPVFDGFFGALSAGSAGAACALRTASAAAETTLAALGRWVAESITALARGACTGGIALHDALRSSLLRLAAVLPRTAGKGGGDAIDWRTVGLAGGLVFTAAAAVYAFQRNLHLRDELYRRDRELAKLVMRIMGLQEALAGYRGRGPRCATTTTTTTTTHAAFTGFARSMAYL